jgi:hypothetical protein
MFFISTWVSVGVRIFQRSWGTLFQHECPQMAALRKCRPLLDQLGVEPGRISGSLARILVLLAVVGPIPWPRA